MPAVQRILRVAEMPESFDIHDCVDDAAERTSSVETARASPTSDELIRALR